MIKELLPSLILGIFVILVGTGFLLTHIWFYRQFIRDQVSDSTKKDEAHLQRRFRRRVKGSSLLILIGFTIPLVDYLITYAPQKITAVVTLLLLVLLVIVLLLISIGDLIATQHYRRNIKSRLKDIENKKKSLQTEIDVLRFRQGDPEWQAQQKPTSSNDNNDPTDDLPPTQEKLF